MVIELFSSSQWRTQRQCSSIVSTSEIPQPQVLSLPSRGFIQANPPEDNPHLSQLASVITKRLPKTRILANGDAVELNRRKVLASQECQQAHTAHQSYVAVTSAKPRRTIIHRMREVEPKRSDGRCRRTVNIPLSRSGQYHTVRSLSGRCCTEIGHQIRLQTRLASSNVPLEEIYLPILGHG